MEVRSTEVQNNFGMYLKYAQLEEVFITRNGKRVAVLQGYDAFQVAEGKAAYSANQPKLTLEEFLNFTAQSSERYEFISGEVVLQSSPSFQHQKIVTTLGALLREWSQGTKCEAVVAPFNVFLEAFDTTNVVQPDVLVICDLENIDEQGRYSGVPTIVIEVLSESTRSLDMVKKLDLYRAGGVLEYWIASPFSKEVYVYLFRDQEVVDYRVFGQTDQIKSKALDDFNVNASAIFA